MGRELEIFYILIFQCWQILFAFWSEHVFRPGMYNSAICQVLVERERDRERKIGKLTHTLSLFHTHTHTHTHTERQARTEREMEWLLKAAEGSNEIGTA